MNDLAIILVSHYGDRWLRPCLTSIFEHAGDCDLDVIVVNNADDGTPAIVSEFPRARVIRCENRGFAHANNRALLASEARYALMLNVDTQILAGTFEQLVRTLDERPTVGLAGVRQVSSRGELAPTMRRFPNALRSLGEALGSEHFPFRATWLGERELNLELHDLESPCDWTSGSFLVARREALQSAGLLDERFFLYSEEPDLGLRVKMAGWEIRHLPVMTILHHAGREGTDPKLAAQDAFSRIQFAQKHFSQPHRVAYRLALALGAGLRTIVPGSARSAQRRAARSTLKVLFGFAGPPFGRPPGQALAPNASEGVE